MVMVNKENANGQSKAKIKICKGFGTQGLG